MRARVRVRMRNEGKQLDRSQACQNRVGQERVTDWRGGGQAPRLLALLFSWALARSPRWAIMAWQPPGGESQAAHHLQAGLNTA